MANRTNQPVWVWHSVGSAALEHPGKIPIEEPAARAAFVEGYRGIRASKIGPATRLPSTKGDLASIVEKGATREVPQNLLLPWYEGLLLLEELEARLSCDWFDQELRQTLLEERKKRKSGVLSSAIYVERMLLNSAVTGCSFFDGDKEWSFRRQQLNAAVPDDPGHVEAAGFEDIEALLAYLPPWEALCHEKCGFYQDFYQVRWAAPHGEKDFSACENGGDVRGTTWEPDECLPPFCDHMRVAAKRRWCDFQREAEQKAVDERQKAVGSKRPSPSPEPEPVKPHLAESAPELPGAPLKTPLSSPEPARKRSRIKRSGQALDSDMLQSKIGHDLDENGLDTLDPGKDVRTGWPKTAEEYPKGFACAEPPGYCSNVCDCMDDQRLQAAWEIQKKWLREEKRDRDAEECIKNLSSSVNNQFVQRRGLISGYRRYFETAKDKLGETHHMVAAQDIVLKLQWSIKNVLKEIPAQELSLRGLQLPACVFLVEDLDYEATRWSLRDPDWATPPDWLLIDACSGLLSLEKGFQLDKPLDFRVSLSDTEGKLGHGSLGLIPGGKQTWLGGSLDAVMNRFLDLHKCPLDTVVRDVIQERFSEVYDVKTRSSKPCSLDFWLRSLARILRMLRSTVVANVANLGDKSVAP